jgi:trans-4-hydroxy-L-proline dehydratase
MNPRIQKLRQESLDTRESLSPERALLVTRFYESGIAQKEAVPVQRALCFRHIMKNKSLWIGDGELIVGERGPAPKATPTYPEICLHRANESRMPGAAAPAGVWKAEPSEKRPIF